MSELVKYIFLFLIGTTIINFMIAVAARVKTRSKEFNQLVYYWVALFMTYFATAALSKTPEEIAFAFFFQLVPAFIFIHIVRTSSGLRTNWKLFIGAQLIAATLSAWLILKTNVGFTLSLLPICAGLSCLELVTGLGVLAKKNEEVSWIEKGMAYLLISGAINIMNYAFFRLDESAAWWGWSVSIAQYQCLSIFLPLLINHRRQEKERKGLEQALEKLSGKTHYPENQNIEELYRTLEIQIEQKEEFSRQLATTNQKLEAEQEMNEILIKTISHDLANPLTVISAYMEMIATARVSAEDTPKIQDRIRQNLSSAIGMISRIRKAIVKRSEADLVQLAAVDLDLAIQRVEMLFEARLREKNIRLRLEGKSAGVLVLADENALVEHILANIVSNAIKFSYENSEILIRIENQMENVEIEIRDFGIGINPSRADKQRLLSTPGTKGEEGTGFGLIVMGYFLRKFGAEIKIVPHSHQGEKGTSFIVVMKKAIAQDSRFQEPTANIFS